MEKCAKCGCKLGRYHVEHTWKGKTFFFCLTSHKLEWIRERQWEDQHAK